MAGYFNAIKSLCTKNMETLNTATSVTGTMFTLKLNWTFDLTISGAMEETK